MKNKIALIFVIILIVISLFLLNSLSKYKELYSIKQGEYNSLNQYYFYKYKTFLDINLRSDSVKIDFSDNRNLSGSKLILWISDKHCYSCIESICGQLTKFSINDSIKNIIIVASFKSERSFKDLCTGYRQLKFIKSSIDYNTFIHQDYNSPILMVQNSQLNIKNLFIPEKEFEELTKFYLAKVKNEFDLK